MKHYTKKNKKSRLAKGLLCFLLALCPMMTNVSAAQAEEKTIDNYILDLEEGKLWSEDKGTKGAPAAKASLRVERLRINYDTHTIDWQITYNYNREFWAGAKLGVILPETDLSKTQIVRLWEKKEDRNSIVNAERDFKGYQHRWGYNVGTKDFDNEYWNRVQNQLEKKQSGSDLNTNTGPGSDLNTWRDTHRFSKFLVSGENDLHDHVYWRITTYHNEDTVLENVPMVATLANGAAGYGKYKRTAAIGPFGIAAWHQLKIPKRVYVDDIDHITESDKNRIFAVIKEDTDKWLNTLENKERGEREENEAKVEIIDNTYVKTFSDGSKLKLGLKSFVRQRELHVLNQDNVINWKDSVDIALGVNDPEFKNEMIAMPAEGKLPAGLGWDETAITEDVPNGKIRGIPDIDWSKVEGAPGEKQVTFKFNIALRKEDRSINTRPETYKPITITVKQDQGAVPVGVADLPTTPFTILSTLSLSMIGLIFWRRRAQQE